MQIKAMRTRRESEVHSARLTKLSNSFFFSRIANVIVHFLRIYRYSRLFGRKPSKGPLFFSCSHRSFTLLRLGSDGALPHIDSLRTTPKNSSHWALISLIRQCGCSTAIGDHRYVCSGTQMNKSWVVALLTHLP